VQRERREEGSRQGRNPAQFRRTAAQRYVRLQIIHCRRPEKMTASADVDRYVYDPLDLDKAHVGIADDYIVDKTEVMMTDGDGLIYHSELARRFLRDCRLYQARAMA